MKVTQSAILSPNLASEAKKLGAALARLRIARGVNKTKRHCAPAYHEIRHIGWREAIRESRWAKSCAISMPSCPARHCSISYPNRILL